MDRRLYSVETPCYVVDEKRFIENLEILKDVAIRAGCKILLAQKAFSMFSVYPLIGRYLDGTTASGLFEAKLGYEEMGKETHVFSAAYMEKEFDEITKICDHISFNSFAQWQKFGKKAVDGGKSCGIRINPQHSTQEHGIYDPCAEGSRLGVTRENFRPELLEGIEGLHFHTLCEQNSDALIDTLVAVEEKFGEFLPRMKWVNFGGGHHITREDYDREALIECILRFKEKYQVEVYLEPGEAIALNAGYLVSSVLDIVHNGIDIALLDASAACHMPDVIEMPYRPPLWQGGEPKEKTHTYRLAGATCLAGDVIGDYSFTQPLSVGDKLIFMDMAIYSMVKNNTFNGMCLPSIAVLQENGELNIIRKFGYEDFKGRLS
ncbi:carboxynorspermidine decarboxylase [Anaerotignum sp.]|uniref:carboxynorspermidine decarboxylase n=1 Tax=Anaerotignum sp. TaxID=2039241 RepID=UPI0028994EC6|nr:carboxynorspermidine decarboxylase [Anaerotignum sp.]